MLCVRWELHECNRPHEHPQVDATGARATVRLALRVVCGERLWLWVGAWFIPVDRGAGAARPPGRGVCVVGDWACGRRADRGAARAVGGVLPQAAGDDRD